jgi:hypothetical protein
LRAAAAFDFREALSGKQPTREQLRTK